LFRNSLPDHGPSFPPFLPPSFAASSSLFTSPARKINIAKFRAQKVMIMIVTDVAARGIDIPLLDCVINYDFPTTSKVFVHRVGRVARAGRSGIAYNFLSVEEVRKSYVIVGGTNSGENGCLVAWLLGCLVAWLLGCLVAWFVHTGCSCCLFRSLEHCLQFLIV
jgi:hypothetical protein